MAERTRARWETEGANAGRCVCEMPKENVCLSLAAFGDFFLTRRVGEVHCLCCCVVGAQKWIDSHAAMRPPVPQASRWLYPQEQGHAHPAGCVRRGRTSTLLKHMRKKTTFCAQDCNVVPVQILPETCMHSNWTAHLLPCRIILQAHLVLLQQLQEEQCRVLLICLDT